MDHSEAVRLNMVEKYLLGELSPDARDQFEEHYFDCPECAADVRALSTFMATSRTIFHEASSVSSPSAVRRPTRAGWFSWLRPAVAVPAIAALAAVVIFQTAVTIPNLKEQAATQRGGQVYESSFRLQGSTRGESASKVVIDPNQSFALDFDFTPSQTFPSYLGTLVNSSGSAILTFRVSGEDANKELHLVIPENKLSPGTYDLVFTGKNEAMNSGQTNNQVQRLSFAVEFRSK
jgi:Putative zinc-finger